MIPYPISTAITDHVCLGAPNVRSCLENRGFDTERGEIWGHSRPIVRLRTLTFEATRRSVRYATFDSLGASPQHNWRSHRFAPSRRMTSHRRNAGHNQPPLDDVLKSFPFAPPSPPPFSPPSTPSPACICLRRPSQTRAQKEWELFTGQLSAAAAAATAADGRGRPRGFPAWASTEREEPFGLLAEHLPHLVQAADFEDVGR